MVLMKEQIEDIRKQLKKEMQEKEQIKIELIQQKKLNMELNKQLFSFKEETLDILNIIRSRADSIDSELQKTLEENKQYEIVTKKFKDEISKLNQKIRDAENKNMKINRRLNALEQSKFGRLAQKYWEFRKHFLKRVNSK
ncbi:hypothetical protein ACFQZR_11550 [Paenibacillus sp. GCM10027629]|uniref:hypothetical protein n=1 Tax=Paenibacillus sp. GCM10027629 TaxID=3273414 RepID=UPI003635509D